MSRSRKGRRLIDALLQSARRSSRGRVYLSIVAFHLIVLSAAGYGACAVGNVWKMVERYRNARGDELRARERGDELKGIVSWLEKLQRPHRAVDSRESDDAMAHSIVRENAEKMGLQLKSFVASEEAGADLVTLEGAFANVAIWIAALSQDLPLFRVRRFTARSVSSRGDRIEVEILIQKTPNTTELSPLCTMELR